MLTFPATSLQVSGSRGLFSASIRHPQVSNLITMPENTLHTQDMQGTFFPDF